MARILIGADICPIGRNQPLFERGDAEALFQDLLPDLAGADLVIGNLECPFIERPTPIRKTGPSFGVPPACVNGIREGGIGVLGCANNHIMDHGPAGLKTTLQACASAGITTVGVGATRSEAGEMVICRAGGLRVGIMAMAENEFAIATEDAPGANPLDLIDFVRTVTSRRGDYDYLIVLYHGSAEFHVPTPRVQRTCRFMAEQGADAVIVQHPHVLGGWEEYQGAHIVYGQGALLMDEEVYRDRASFHRGFLVSLEVGLGGGKPGFEIIPFIQSDPGTGARKMTGEVRDQMLEHLQNLAARVADPARVEADWKEFCKGKGPGAIASLMGMGRIGHRFRPLRWWMERRLATDPRMLGVRNMVLCETHRELLEAVFAEKLSRPHDSAAADCSRNAV